MTDLGGDFENELREALLDEAEDVVDEETDNLKDLSEEFFRVYAAENGYDISHIWRDATRTPVQRSRRSVRASVSWPALTALFEYGVDPHTIEGDPLLAFNWDAPPEGTRPPGAPSYVVSDSVNWGSVTGGIDAARAIRNSLDEVRSDLRSGP